MAKKILDELKWHPKKSLRGVEITYIHRGAPNDIITIPAEDIIEFEKSFFIVKRNHEKTRIPYHRITEIWRGNKLIWMKK